MMLTQTGDTVTGTYSWQDGQIAGSVAGNKFSGRWSEAPRAGTDDFGNVTFTMNATCDGFAGAYGYDTDGNAGQYPWSGSLVGR